MKVRGLEALSVLSVVLAMLVSLPAAELWGQGQPTPHTLALDPEGKMRAATVADVGWLTGQWRGEGFGGTVEEIWAAPLGGAMVGMFRLVKPQGPVFYELLTMVEEQGSLALRLKHFQPDLTGWEEKEGSTAVVFPLVKLAPKAAYFRGLTFEKTEENTLVITLALRSKDGTLREEKFSLHRVTY